MSILPRQGVCFSCGHYEGTLREGLSLSAVLQENQRLRAELEASQKDADRYHLTREGFIFTVPVLLGKNKVTYYVIGPRPEANWGTSLDATLDGILEKRRSILSAGLEESGSVNKEVNSNPV